MMSLNFADLLLQWKRGVFCEMESQFFFGTFVACILCLIGLDWIGVFLPRYVVAVSMVRMRGALPPLLFMLTVVTIFLNYSRQCLTGIERVGMEEFDKIWIFLCIYPKF
jgi:hypothetical protein